MIKFDENWEWKMMREISEEELTFKEQTFKRELKELATSQYSVRVYPYRTALVNHVMFDADRSSMSSFEEMLAAKSGVQPDNHVVYELLKEGQPVYFILCSDSLFRVGKRIKKENW